MNPFTVEENNLISLYNPAGRPQLISVLLQSLSFVEEDMAELTLSLINRLERMTDVEFDELHFTMTDEDLTHEQEV